MRVHRCCLPALLVLAAGCRSGTGPAAPEPDGAGSAPNTAIPTPTAEVPVSTGIEGTAYRSPTLPVCRVDEPCRAPFTAGFEVRKGEQAVARFRSDQAGHFLVYLPPGTYTVVPDESGSALARSQVHQVTVGPGGLTHVDWDFDTGIR
jgi:hypothetical protein